MDLLPNLRSIFYLKQGVSKEKRVYFCEKMEERRLFNIETTEIATQCVKHSERDTCSQSIYRNVYINVCNLFVGYWALRIEESTFSLSKTLTRTLQLPKPKLKTRTKILLIYKSVSSNAHSCCYNTGIFYMDVYCTISKLIEVGKKGVQPLFGARPTI